MSLVAYRLQDILFISFCTLLSNGEDFEDMIEFGKQRQSWLEECLELPNGIPSHDTFNRVLELVDSEQLIDLMRSRKGNAPQNMNVLRKMALQRIANMTDKLSLKKRRFRASINPSYLQKVVRI